MAIKNKYNFINLDYLELMADGDEAMKKIMLDMLLEELPTELQKMRQLADAADWQELSNVSHKMKSTLAYVGNDEMTITNKTVETLCKSGENLDEMNALIIALENQLDKVFPELKMEQETL